MTLETTTFTSALPAVDIRLFAEHKLTNEQVAIILREAARKAEEELDGFSGGGHFDNGGIWNMTVIARPKDLPRAKGGLDAMRESLANAEPLEVVAALHERCLKLEAERDRGRRKEVGDRAAQGAGQQEHHSTDLPRGG